MFTLTLAVCVSAQADEPQAAKVDDRLDPTPMVVDSLGLRFNPPRNAQLVVHRTNVGVTATILDGSELPTWRMTVQFIRPDLPEPSPQGQIDTLAEQLREYPQYTSIIERGRIATRNATGEFLYASQQAGEEGDRIVTGWLALPGEGDLVLIFSIYTTPAQYDIVRPLLDAAFATIEVRPLSEVTGEREKRIERGRKLLDRIGESILREHLQTPELSGRKWYRHYLREDGTEREIGYSVVEIHEAQRGRVNPGRDPSRYSEADKELGLMVHVQARMIGDAERGLYFDTEAFYWQSWNRHEETWTVRTTARQGDIEQSESETGVRSSAEAGDLVSKLQVIKAESRRETREPVEWTVPESYLSQADRWLLGFVMLHLGIEDRSEFAYYYYDSNSSRISLRHDTWKRVTGDSDVDPSGAAHRVPPQADWALISRFTADDVETVTYFNERGETILRTRPDGARMEPITPGELERIWQRRGLQRN